MRARLRVLLLAVATAPTGCSAIVGDYEVAAVTGGISTARLCEIERQAYAFEIDRTSTAHELDLETYYEIANPQLTAHLDALAQAYGAGTPGAGVTYVMGAAGVGKSFAMRNLDGFAATEQCEVLLAELFGAGAPPLDFTVVQAPDLATVDGQLAFNELPAMEDPTAFNLTTFLAAAGCEVAGTLLPLIAIDGLDEIHNASSTAILQAIDRFILDGAIGAGPFVHFVVAGRPEAFNTWLADPGRTEDNNAILDAFTLEAPRYRTAGDLDFRVRGYLDFSGQLAGLETSGQLDGYIASVIDAVASHPFLTYTMANLAIGNIAIEHTRPGVNEGEQQIKIGLFDDIVQRAASTHGRPDAGSALSGPYLRLLENIAVHYIDVGDDGVFEVLSEDRLEVRDDAGAVLGEVRVRDVLDRGGVALLTSAFASGTRYHFDPFWVHAHLVERHNQRTIGGYVYRTCR
jgi:hypothetical protein